MAAGVMLICAMAAGLAVRLPCTSAFAQAQPAAAPASAPAFDAAGGIRTTDADLAKRLAELNQKLESKRADQHIPGMAIAVVKDGEVVLARGFGVKDLATLVPPDENTLFAIGSQTKAFTAMLISLMTDEGKMSWDDPVRKFVPAFRLFDKDANDQVLLRDLCSHRTGLPRTDLLWASGKASKQEMMARLAFAEPTAKFREQFQYNNSMFMVAGMAAENAGSATWPELISSRIFKPLGMSSSNTHISVMQQSPNYCLGYAWDTDRKEHKRLPMREITCDGAGAINSTAMDMSHWLRMHLAKGMYEGKRFVSEAMEAEMWHRQIDMTPTQGYGLGWMLGNWNGHRVVDHGGNIDGFFTACAMLPDDHVGFVLFGSLTYASLQSECLPMVWETFFPPPSSPEGSMSEAQLNLLVGTYRAEVLNADTKINIKDGKLHWDVPGQMNFELKWPDKDGKWAFAMMPEAIQLRFNKDPEGRIVSITTFQNGAEIDCPRLGDDGKPLVAEAPPPLSRAELEALTGTYHFSPTNLDWKVVITEKGKLAVDVPQQRVFDLKWPDENGKWKVLILPASCQFNRDAAGKVESMTWFQGGELVLPRTAAGVTTDLPSVDQISELRRRSADPERLKAMGNIEVLGKVRAVNQGVDGKVRGLANADGRMLQDIDMGVFGVIRVSYDGEKAWTESVGEAYSELTGERLEEVRKAGSQFLISDLKTLFDTAEVTERTTLDGKDVIVVKGHTAKPDKTVRQYVDASSGLPLKEESSVLIPGLGRLPTTVLYSDYREIQGVMVPMKITISTAANGSMEFIIETVNTNVPLAADAYELKKSR